MAGLDVETREMILTTLKKYAERRLKPEYLIELDHKDEFPPTTSCMSCTTPANSACT